MKKLISLFIIIVSMFFIFADGDEPTIIDSGSMEFFVRWLVNNNEVTTISILPYSKTGSLPTDGENNYLVGIEPEDNETLYNVCCVRYTTNKKGSHKLSFTATPLTNRTGEDAIMHPYTLYLAYNNTSGLPLYITTDGNNNERDVNLSISVINTPSDILVDAVITDLDEMVIGNFTSTITIARYGQ